MEKELLNGIKARFSKELMARIEAQHINFPNAEEFKEDFRRTIEGILKSILKENRDIRLARVEQEDIFSEIISDILSLGPIYKLLIDPAIMEIMINGPKEVYVEREGKLGMRARNQRLYRQRMRI